LRTAGVGSHPRERAGEQLDTASVVGARLASVRAKFLQPGRRMRSAAGTGFDRRRILYFSFSLRTGPPLPPKVTLDQATKLVEALARGTPGAREIIRNIAMDKLRELV
jgi:hypothetical protein